MSQQQNNNSNQDQNNNSSSQSPDGAIKDPQNWKSGDDPATPSQLSYLNTLAEQANEETPAEDITKAEASEEINRLRQAAGISDSNS